MNLKARSRGRSAADYDVIGWGVVAVDDIFHVEHFPPADAKIRATRTDRRLGGLTGVALRAVADLGGKACYAGVLGDDLLSEFARSALRGGGVDVGHVLTQPEARPVHAMVVVAAADGSRTIFYTTAGRLGRQADEELRAALLRSRVLLVDPFSLSDSEPMLALAREKRIPVVADLETEHVGAFRHLAPLIDHMVVPLAAGRELTLTADGGSLPVPRAFLEPAEFAPLGPDGLRGRSRPRARREN